MPAVTSINALNGLNHAALALKELGNVLALIGLPRNRIGRNRFGGFTSSLHEIKPLWNVGSLIEPIRPRVTGQSLDLFLPASQRGRHLAGQSGMSSRAVSLPWSAGIAV